MYHLKIDHKVVTAFTVKSTWKMTHINPVLQEMRGVGVFAAIDFTSGYWQLPMHADSQPLRAFMTPEGVVEPTQTIQGDFDSAVTVLQTSRLA